MNMEQDRINRLHAYHISRDRFDNKSSFKKAKQAIIQKKPKHNDMQNQEERRLGK